MKTGWVTNHNNPNNPANHPKGPENGFQLSTFNLKSRNLDVFFFGWVGGLDPRIFVDLVEGSSGNFVDGWMFCCLGGWR